jgi:O-antigen ligase
MKVAESQSGQPLSLPLSKVGYGLGIFLTILVCLITGTDWQAGLTLTLVVAYLALISIRLEWGIYVILACAVLFIDGWAPNRSPEDVVFRLRIARVYIVEFAVYGLLAMYSVQRAFGQRAGTWRGLFVRTALDAPLKAFALLLPTFAVYGYLKGNPLQDSFGYFEWRSLFLAIPFYYLVTTLIDSREQAVRLATWVFGLIAIKGFYYLPFALLQAKYPLPDVIGAGPMDEGPENVMFMFAALAGISFLMFGSKTNWWARIVVLATVLLLLVNLWLSAKRSAQLGLAVGFIFLLWRLPRRQKLKFGAGVAAVLVGIFLVFATFQISSPQNDVGQSVSRYNEIIQFVHEPASMLTSNGTLAFHLMDLVDATTVIIQRPLLGYGFGSRYDRQLTSLENVGGQEAGLEAGVVHDLYLHVWWKTGLVGLGIFCWLVVRIVRFGVKAICRVPSTEAHAIALGLYSAILGELAMDVWGPQWFSSTKVSLIIFCSLALIMRLVQLERGELSISRNDSPARETL